MKKEILEFNNAVSTVLLSNAEKGIISNTEELNPQETASLEKQNVDDQGYASEDCSDLLDYYVDSVITRSKTLEFVENSWEIAREVIFRFICELELTAGPDVPKITTLLFEKEELEDYNSSYPPLKTQVEDEVVDNTEEEYFTSEFWDLMVDRILKRNRQIRKVPGVRILIGVILHNFLDSITKDTDGITMKLVLAQMVRKGIKESKQNYSLKEIEEISGLSVKTIIALLNDSLYRNQPITNESTLSPLDVSFVYFLADHFLKESRGRNGR